VVNFPIVNAYQPVPPEVTALADGGHLVVWEAAAGGGNPDTSGFGVYAQRYDALGAKVGAPVLANTTTNYDQQFTSAAGLNDGSWVVTWSSINQDGSGYGVYGQRFAADGSKAGGEFRINQTTANNQLEATVSELANGGFVVSWNGGNALSAAYDIYARVFDSAGTAQTGEFVVNTVTAGYQFSQGWEAESVVGLSGGRFAVVWNDPNGIDGSSGGVYARVFEANGTAVNAAQQLVNTITSNVQDYGSVGALQNGGFVVSWSSNGQDGSGWGVYAQRFDANGAKVGGEVRANTWTNNDQLYSKVAGLADGGHVVAWQSYGVDGSNTLQISGQRYDSAGQAVGGEFIVNSFSLGNNDFPSIALRDDGALIVAWRDSTSGTIEQKIITAFDSVVMAKDLLGGAGNDSFIGSPFGDSLTGAGGDDVLTGLGGADTFAFTDVADGLDTITDFHAGLFGDKLDVSAVLSAYDGNLAGFVQLSASGGDTVFSVDADGGADNFVALAMLQNVTFTSTLLNDLMANGNLVVA
jgi:hypothetical protein